MDRGGVSILNKKLMIIGLSIGGFFLICAMFCCLGGLFGSEEGTPVIIDSTATSIQVKPTTRPTPTKKIELKEYELDNGNYYSGEDFNAGVYDIVALKGTGTVQSDNIFSGGINAMMGVGDEEFYETEYKNIELPDGTKLIIKNVKIKLIQKK
jgi:hypothetical protein